MLQWFNKQEQSHDLANKYAELTQAHKRLQEECDGLRKHIEELNSETRMAKPIIDFDSMRVFSIERMVHNGAPTTIIGYWLQEPVMSNDGEMIVMRDIVKEWYLHCNSDRHVELVAQYLSWKGSKND